MAKAEKHKWTFRAHFRKNAFGWRSQPAIKRVKEAVSEIKKVARMDKVLAAEGAVLLLEKVSPALAHVDSSSGAIDLWAADFLTAETAKGARMKVLLVIDVCTRELNESGVRIRASNPFARRIGVIDTHSWLTAD